MVGTGRVNAVFVGDDLPELGADLVAALACLDVDDFAHLYFFFKKKRRGDYNYNIMSVLEKESQSLFENNEKNILSNGIQIVICRNLLEQFGRHIR